MPAQNVAWSYAVQHDVATSACTAVNIVGVRTIRVLPYISVEYEPRPSLSHIPG